MFPSQLGRLFQMLEGLGTQMERDGLLDRYRNQEPSAISVEGWSILTKKLFKDLPFSLTPSQLNAVSEIIWDLKRPIPMNRLLQVTMNINDLFCFIFIFSLFFFSCFDLSSLC